MPRAKEFRDNYKQICFEATKVFDEKVAKEAKLRQISKGEFIRRCIEKELAANK
jgi:hypothetical protein